MFQRLSQSIPPFFLMVPSFQLTCPALKTAPTPPRPSSSLAAPPGGGAGSVLPGRRRLRVGGPRRGGSTAGEVERERESGVRLDPPSWPVSKDHRCPQGRLVAGCTKRCQNTSPNEHQNHVLHICGKNHARIVAGMNGRLYTPEDIAEHRSDLTAGQMSEHVRTLARKNFRTHYRTYPSRYAIDDA